jgi:hypothetical protein
VRGMRRTSTGAVDRPGRRPRPGPAPSIHRRPARTTGRPSGRRGRRQRPLGAIDREAARLAVQPGHAALERPGDRELVERGCRVGLAGAQHEAEGREDDGGATHGRTAHGGPPRRKATRPGAEPVRAKHATGRAALLHSPVMHQTPIEPTAPAPPRPRRRLRGRARVARRVPWLAWPRLSSRSWPAVAGPQPRAARPRVWDVIVVGSEPEAIARPWPRPRRGAHAPRQQRPAARRPLRPRRPERARPAVDAGRLPARRCSSAGGGGSAACTRSTSTAASAPSPTCWRRPGSRCGCRSRRRAPWVEDGRVVGVLVGHRALAARQVVDGTADADLAPPPAPAAPGGSERSAGRPHGRHARVPHRRVDWAALRRGIAARARLRLRRRAGRLRPLRRPPGRLPGRGPGPAPARASTSAARTTARSW